MGQQLKTPHQITSTTLFLVKQNQEVSLLILKCITNQKIWERRERRRKDVPANSIIKIVLSSNFIEENNYETCTTVSIERI